MKIAMMTNNYKPFVGGVPISVERLAQGLRLRGHEVCVFAPEYEGYEDDAGEDIVRYRSFARCMKNGMVIPNVLDPKIQEAFACRDFDLIHTHHPMLIGNVAVRLSQRYQIPLVYTYHTRYEEYLHYLNPFSKKRENNAEHFLQNVCRRGLPCYMSVYMRKCSMIYAPSMDMKAFIERQSDSAMVQILPTGLEDSSYQPDQEQAEKIRTRYLDGKQYLFCTVSRLEQEKNLHFLFQSVRKMKQKMGAVFRMMVIGDGEERKDLESLARELQIQDTIRFVGKVPNCSVKDYLFASDAFLFASLSETQGIVLAEAMAAGLPVIAVDACGVHDIVRNGKNGYLVGENEDEFAGQVRMMMNHKDGYKKLKDGALHTADGYHMSCIAKKAEMDYSMMLERERSREYYGCQTGWKKDAESSVLRLL